MEDAWKRHSLLHSPKLDLQFQALELRGKRLPNPLHISLPLVALTRDLSVRERLADIPRDLEDTHGCFLGFFDLLLNSVVLGLEREDGSVALR